MDEFIKAVFNTHAFEYCESHIKENGIKEPFIINAKKLYGSKEDYDKIQQFINKELQTEKKSNIPIDIFEKIIEHYENNELYRLAIDSIKNWIETNVNMKYVDYISGGESSDWLFSIILAYLFGKPHMAIFKDGTVVVTTCDFEEGNEVAKVEDCKIMHVSDILKKGYYHCNCWFRAIRDIGSDIFWSISIFDLNEGGSDRIKEYNAEPLSIFQATETFFVRSLELGFLTSSQFSVLRKYTLELNNKKESIF